MEFETNSATIGRQPVGGGQRARRACAAARSHPVILCVDDDADVLTILRLFLSTQRFEVITALNAAEGRRLAEEHLPDLVITDDAMPGMSGRELCRALRDCGSTRDIPIILHSAKDVCEDDPDLFDRFVMKPTELDVFLRTIRALLDSGSSQRRLELARSQPRDLGDESGA
ncbi:MAG: response regulator [Steroidobacteraceae bacterium]